jgi:hypothetical protein
MSFYSNIIQMLYCHSGEGIALAYVGKYREMI